MKSSLLTSPDGVTGTIRFTLPLKTAVIYTEILILQINSIKTKVIRNLIYLIIPLFFFSFTGSFNNLYAQIAEISPGPSFKKDIISESTLKKQTKAKYHDGALVFSYAEDVVLKDKLQKNFIIEIEEGSDYFLASFLNAVYDVPDLPAPEMKDKKYPLQEINVYVDGQPLGGLDIKKSGWSSSKLQKDKAINLSAGRHVITFEAEIPNTPSIDLIKLSKSYEKAEFDNTGYEDFLEKLKANMDRNKDNKRKIEQAEIDAEYEKERENELKSAANPNPDWQVIPYFLDIKGGNYKHMMNVPVVYTYYNKIYLSKGTNVDFFSQPNPPDSYYSVDPVMYLFSEDNFNNSWANDDGHVGFQPRITVKIPSSGYYYLVLRAYSSSYAGTPSGMQGLVDIYKNGALFQDDAPVSGHIVNVATSHTGTLNYFTAYSTGIPKLWLAPNGATSPIQFHGSTYWYVPPMDYYWFDDARFRIVKNTSSSMNMYLLVSSEGAWWVYWGNCDVYGSCKQGYKNDFKKDDGTYAFPNMKDNDIIRSADPSNNYNCASWAGGRTDLGRYFWASDSPTSNNHSSDWYVQPYIPPYYYSYQQAYFMSWDNFFGNNPPRFSGAPSYSRTAGGTPEIALWTGNHASVRILGNNNPHGYSWESKCGGNYRIFHPAESFSGGIYGTIETYYYRDAGTKSASIDNYLTLQESLDYGLTIIPEVYLTSEEEDYVTYAIKLKSAGSNEFDKKFSLVIDKANSPELINYSHPKFLFDSEEYKDLFKFCEENRHQILNNLILKSFSDDNLTSEIASGIYIRLTSKSYPDLMEEVKDEWRKNSFTGDGAYIAPSVMANEKNYIKKTINIQMGKTKAGLIDDENSLMKNNEEIFSIYPNPVFDNATAFFSLSESRTVSINIYDMQGKLRVLVVENQIYDQGNHEVLLNLGNLEKGLYICKLNVGENVYNRKIMIK